jgi:hypothetical protein
MDTERFIARHPVLFHMTDAECWPSIKRYGLLSATEIVRRWEIPSDRAEAILTRRRPESVHLDHPDLGHVVLRDQRPLSEVALANALTNCMTVAEWLRLLNAMVFLFPSGDGLRGMYKRYSAEPAVVLTVDTRSLVSSHHDRIRLARINTGNTRRKPALRGVATFQTILDLDQAKSRIREVAVLQGVPDVRRHLVSAERWNPDGSVEPLEY